MTQFAKRPPSEEPIAREIGASDGSLVVWEWPGPGPTVFFAHATGFHARCWDEVIRRLPAIRALALDTLGHGRSAEPAPPEPYRWARLARGATEAVNQLGLQDALGVGHSMGAYLLVRAAAAAPTAFNKLLLVDPSILPKGTYGRAEPSMGTSFVLRHRSIWNSPEEMIERFTGRPPFGHWKSEVLDDYCRFGLKPDGEGAFRLACRPETEAAVYAATASDSPYSDIARVEVPVRVLRARQRPAGLASGDMSHSPTAPGLASPFRQGEDALFSEHTHYIPMEDPDLVAGQIQQMVGAGGN
ncbi:MAG TPA: alpha/beta hydrolase [Tepidiformaceae bacterium]|nr:alpha/beta hydrolase [Tepidiformaceae bacterium]